MWIEWINICVNPFPRKWVKLKFLFQDADMVSLAIKCIVLWCFVCRNYDKILMESFSPEHLTIWYKKFPWLFFYKICNLLSSYVSLVVIVKFCSKFIDSYKRDNMGIICVKYKNCRSRDCWIKSVDKYSKYHQCWFKEYGKDAKLELQTWIWPLTPNSVGPF